MKMMLLILILSMCILCKEERGIPLHDPIFGPSKVCALPLGVAAERSVHYFWDYFYRSPLITRGRDQQVAIFLLLHNQPPSKS